MWIATCDWNNVHEENKRIRWIVIAWFCTGWFMNQMTYFVPSNKSKRVRKHDRLSTNLEMNENALFWWTTGFS